MLINKANPAGSGGPRHDSVQYILVILIPPSPIPMFYPIVYKRVV